MSKVTKIHKDKTPQRIHFIAEWIAFRGLSQADVVNDLGVNKGTVSKWCAGSLPQETNLAPIAALLQVDVPTLFRHPDDDWLARLFEGRSQQEKERMIKTLNAAFPKATGTDGPE
jgi:transcriptional regulator with XRE-family HTH domain